MKAENASSSLDDDSHVLTGRQCVERVRDVGWWNDGGDARGLRAVVWEDFLWEGEYSCGKV